MLNASAEERGDRMPQDTDPSSQFSALSRPLRFKDFDRRRARNRIFQLKLMQNARSEFCS